MCQMDDLPKPPAWASMIPVDTGVPLIKPISSEDFKLNPLPAGTPGNCTSLPNEN